MKDKDYLIWLHERLVHVHKENPHVDYMCKLRSIIEATPADQSTPNTSVSKSIDELRNLGSQERHKQGGPTC